jgi:hypothetical protein
MMVSFGGEALDRIGAAHIEISSRRCADLADIVALSVARSPSRFPAHWPTTGFVSQRLAGLGSSASLSMLHSRRGVRRLVDLGVGATRRVRSSSTS